MKVRCIAEFPTEDQLKKLDKIYSTGRHVFRVCVGKEYVVLALEIRKGAPWIQFGDDTNIISLAPLCLFEITDGRPSKYWEIRITENGEELTLWPPSFYQEYYHDDLSEDVPEVVADYERVRKLIEEEANDSQDENEEEF